jgi:adenine deaminase
MRGDILLVDDLKDFKAQKVFIEGKLVANDGIYTGKYKKANTEKTSSTVKVKELTIDKLNLNSKSEEVKVIQIVPGEIITKKVIEKIKLNESGDFIFDRKQDIVKIVIVERHQQTGNVAVGLLKGYGLKKGAVAQTIAHDSHNIVAVGVDNQEIMKAIEEIIAINGGIVIVENGNVIQKMALPIGGLMSEEKGQQVAEELENIQSVLIQQFGVNPLVEPIMTLAFMSLPVIPELKITDMGLFDVNEFSFTSIEADKD